LPSDQSQLQDILALIELSVFDPSAMPLLYQSIAERLGAEGIGLQIIDKQTSKTLYSFDAGIDASDHRRYYDEVYLHNPRVPQLMATPVGRVFTDLAITSPEQRRSNHYYAWLGSIGYREGICLKLLDQPDCLGAIAFERRADTRLPLEDALALAETLSGPLSRAAAIGRHLALAEFRSQGFAAAASAAVPAAALLSLQGRVVDANAGFRAIVDRRDGLFLADGEPCGSVAAGVQALRRAITNSLDALRTGQGTGNSAALLPRRNGRPPYRVFVQPIRPTTSEQAGFCWGFEAGLLLLVDEPDRAASLARVNALASLYRLTPAEIRVADGLSRGNNVTTIAADHGVSVTTVRSQLKRILEKTETSRQGELIALINRLPA
jgi:DNA-binding CsgD family transcriptional regulator